MAINDDPDFSPTILEIFNSMPILQIHLYTKYTNQVEFVRTKLIYPAIFKGQILLSAHKSYWASRQSGKMTFKFKENTEENND